MGAQGKHAGRFMLWICRHIFRITMHTFRISNPSAGLSKPARIICAVWGSRRLGATGGRALRARPACGRRAGAPGGVPGRPGCGPVPGRRGGARTAVPGSAGARAVPAGSRRGPVFFAARGASAGAEPPSPGAGPYAGWRPAYPANSGLPPVSAIALSTTDSTYSRMADMLRPPRSSRAVM